MKKLRLQLQLLNPWLQLLIAFSFNYFFWLLFYFLFRKVWPDAEEMPIRAMLFKAVFMGIFWTLLFNWAIVKKCFKKDE